MEVTKTISSRYLSVINLMPRACPSDHNTRAACCPGERVVTTMYPVSRDISRVTFHVWPSHWPERPGIRCIWYPCDVLDLPTWTVVHLGVPVSFHCYVTSLCCCCSPIHGVLIHRGAEAMLRPGLMCVGGRPCEAGGSRVCQCVGKYYRCLCWKVRIWKVAPECHSKQCGVMKYA